MANKLEKQLTSNKRKLLSKELRNHENYRYSYVEDFDEEEGLLFVEKYDNETEMYKEYKLSYTANEDYSQINIQEDATEVVELDMFMDVVKSQESKLDKVLGYFEKHFGGSSKEDESVLKQFNDVKKTTTEFLYVAPNEVDGVGDTYLEEDAQPMVDSFNKSIEEGRLQSGLFHKHSSGSFKVVKAFLAEEDTRLGEFDIVKGQPLVEIEYLSEKLYELRKENKIMGPSIGARAKEIIEVDENGVEKSLGGAELVLGKGNPLDSIKGERKVKRILKGIHFDWDNPELTLTDYSVGGACSLKNDIILEKSMVKPPNKEQAELLAEIGEEFTPLLKQLNSDEVDNTGVTQQNEETKGTDMSEEALQKALDKIAELERINKSQTLKSEVLAGYGFEAEVEKGLVDLMVGLDDTTAITKALDALVAAKDEAITKAKAEVQPENEIAKALSEEQGAAEVESEEEVVKSLEEQVIEKLKAKQGAK